MTHSTRMVSQHQHAEQGSRSLDVTGALQESRDGGEKLSGELSTGLPCATLCRRKKIKDRSNDGDKLIETAMHGTPDLQWKHQQAQKGSHLLDVTGVCSKMVCDRITPSPSQSLYHTT